MKHPQNTITSRLHQDSRDSDAITNLVLANSPQANRSPTDLREALAQVPIQANTRLWLDLDDRLLAYAFVNPYRNLHFEIAEVGDKAELEGLILAWGANCILRMASPGETNLSLDASCRAEDHSRLSTSSQNKAMLKTAASAGFFTVSRALWFSKTLEVSRE